jgi:pathogenesis-related protein 1
MLPPMRAAFVLILFGAACAPPRGEQALPSEEIQQPIVDEHNLVRSNVTTPTPNPALEPLTWSADLASVAQSHANKCVFEHSTGNNFGENLAFFSCPGAECDEDDLGSTPADAVRIWADEVSDYDYESNSCAPGAQCGHYTQLVWRDTERVGCGSSICNIDGFNGVYWVCNYDPPGNFIGERPY